MEAVQKQLQQQQQQQQLAGRSASLGVSPPPRGGTSYRLSLLVSPMHAPSFT